MSTPFFMRIIFLTYLLFFFCLSSGAQIVVLPKDSSQNRPPTGRFGDNFDRDTVLLDSSVVLFKKLEAVELLSLRTFKRKRNQRRYNRLVERVKRTYPLAKLAAQKMELYGQTLANGTRKDRKALIRQFEKELKEEHGAKLRRMSFADGRILLRLIDRETQNTPFELVKDLKGSFQAVFWQGVANIFDYDLKAPFDPSQKEEDLYIDEICRMIDAGIISMP